VGVAGAGRKSKRRRRTREKDRIWTDKKVNNAQVKDGKVKVEMQLKSVVGLVRK
jgi:hypothetical protein